MAAEAAHLIIACIERGMVCRVREAVVLPYAAPVRPWLAYSIEFGVLYFWKDVDKMEHVQRRVTGMVKGFIT